MVHRFIAIFGVFVLIGVLSCHTVVNASSPRFAVPQQDEENGERTVVSGISKTLAGQGYHPIAAADSQTFAQDILMSETFEGSFPAAGWQLENYSSAGEYLWGKRNCHPHSGDYAGWSVGAGADGSQLECANEYPDNVNTWAIFGPFSLSTATSAQVNFFMWGSSEFESGCNYDGLFVGASTDGYYFDGDIICGNWEDGPETNGYHPFTVDLSDFVGESQVYLAFNFYSDYSRTDIGYHIDDISLVMAIGSTTLPPTTPPPATTVTPPSGQKFVHLPLVVRDYPPQPTPTPVPTLTPTQGQPTPTSGLTNLVINGGFESGSFSPVPWLTYGGSRLSVYCRTGSYCMQICSEFANLSQCSPGFYQSIKIPNDVVSLSLKFYWRGNVYRSTSTNQMYAKIYDGTSTYFTTSRLYYDGDVGYRRYSFVLDPVTVANMRGKTVQLGFYDDKFFMAQIYYIVDDVELIATK